MKNIQNALVLLSIFILLSSCVKEYGHDNITLVKTGIEALNVPDDFNYAMYAEQNVNINFAAGSSRLLGSEMIQYAVIGTDLNDSIYGLKSGHISLIEGLGFIINKPLHIEEIFLYTKYNGNAQFFDLNAGEINISVADLVIDDQLFENNNARVSSIPNCTSFIGNATKISCKNDTVTIKSSASFKYVDITFYNDVVSRFTTDEIGEVNANMNQWTFSGLINGYAIGQIRSFTVFAECRTSPSKVGIELVTFVNPCIDLSIDSDNDGVTDEYDIAPNDPNVSSAVYLPAYDGYATFACEDMWPHKGDYDFNDLVVSHKATVYANAENMVTKVKYDFKIRAIGARFNNDFCISFTDPTHIATLGSLAPADINYQKIAVDDLTELRFVRFREMYGADGLVNTDTSNQFIEPIEVSIELLFDGSVSLDNFKIEEYLRINQEDGREVHKPGEAFTSLMDLSLLGFADDDTNPAALKYFKTGDNLPWALEIPIEWEYPKEQIEITSAYPNFKDFAQGSSTSPWYSDANENKVQKHLYSKE
jgi:LruC domain-containing protein